MEKESACKESQQQADASIENGRLVNEITVMVESSEPSLSFGCRPCRINRVPDHLRKVNEEAFTPRVISIGPIHQSNEKLQAMEKYKVRFFKSFLNRSLTKLEILVSTISNMVERIHCCYGETIVPSKCNDAFVKKILMDAIFILELFLRKSDKIDESGKNDDPLTAEHWMPTMVTHDLVLLENQLPFFVLEELYSIAIPSGPKSRSLMELTIDFFDHYNIQNMSHEEISTGEISHFTDLLRIFQLCCPLDLPKRTQGVGKPSYSATLLHEAGVKFRVSSEKSLLCISFDLKDGELEIPRLTLFNYTEVLIRNIIALEQSHYLGNTYVTDYFVILDFLINTTKDMDLLCDKGIVDNYLGDNKAATSLINNLNTNIVWFDMNRKYKHICKRLNKFYEKPWHRWKASLRHRYCNTPWRAASTFAAIALLGFTLTQTICSVIQVA